MYIDLLRLRTVQIHLRLYLTLMIRSHTADEENVLTIYRGQEIDNWHFNCYEIHMNCVAHHNLKYTEIVNPVDVFMIFTYLAIKCSVFMKAELFFRQSGYRNFRRGNYLTICALQGHPRETKLTHASNALIHTQVLLKARKAWGN